MVHLVANEGQPIENHLIRGIVLGHKVDENGQAAPGAVMGLFRPEETEFTEDTALLISVSNEHGEFRFDDIPFGDWLVREIRQPEGFLLSETLYPVTIGTEPCGRNQRGEYSHPTRAGESAHRGRTPVAEPGDGLGRGGGGRRRRPVHHKEEKGLRRFVNRGGVC